MKLAVTISLILVFQTLTAQIKAQSEPKLELIVQTGHTSGVNSVAFSPDGKTIASGSDDETIKLWSVETGQELRTLAGNIKKGVSVGWVNSVAFSPDGAILAAAGEDNAIKLWNSDSGQEIKTLSGHSNAVKSISFSPDGRFLASGSDDGTTKLWNIETGREIKTFTGLPNDKVASVAFSPDGMLIAAAIGNTEETIDLWSAETGQLMRTIDLKFAIVNSIEFSPDGKTIAAGGENNFITLWNIESGQETTKIKKSDNINNDIRSIAFSPDGKMLALGYSKTVSLGNNKDTVKLFNAETGQELKTLAGQLNILRSLTFSPDGRTIAAGSNKTITIWNAETGRQIKTFSGYANNDRQVIFSPDGKNIASAGGLDSFGDTIRLWNVKDGESLQIFKGHNGYVTSIVFSPDGTILASASIDTKVKLWNVETGQEINTLSGNSTALYALVFAPDGKTLAASTKDGKIIFWETATGNKIKTLAGHSSIVYSMVFSPDGKIFASGSYDGTLKLWSVETGQELRSLIGHTDKINSIEFSLNGKIIVSSSFDKTIKLWNAETGQEINTLAGNTKEFLGSAALSPDGAIVASASDVDTINLWNVKTGELIKSLEKSKPNTTREIFSLVPDFTFDNYEAITKDGLFQVKIGENGRLDLYEVKTGKMLASLIALGKTDWAVVASNGLFDGSPNAWKMLWWRLNDKLYDVAPVEAFFKEFYYPGLLKEILQGKTPHPPEKSLSQVDVRPPGVTFLAINLQKTEGAQNLMVETRTVKIAVGVVENSRPPNNPKFSPTGGARDLRLFRNGSLVKIWNKSIFDLTEKDGCQQISPTKEIPVRRTICEAEIQMITGDNNFSAYAFNGDNVKSMDAELAVKGADSLRRSGTLYVLAIGANKYANPNYDLRYAVADVKSITQALKAQQAALSNYAATEVVELTDKNATKANILAALNRFGDDKKTLPANAPADLQKIKKLQPEDALVIYYAGHGTASKDRFYLIPHDGFPLNGTGEKYYEELYGRSVSDENLESLLEMVDAGKILLVIDACNSGQALEAEEKRRGPMNSKGLAQLAYEKGIYILTAAQSFQSALEVSQTADGKAIEHGLLTYSLLEGLKAAKADANSDKQISEREWLNFAVAEVPQMQIKTMRRRDAKINESPTQRSTAVSISGGKSQLSTQDRGLQTPRVFYRREDDAKPLVVAARLER